MAYCADADVGGKPLRAPEAAKWQPKYRVDWDATDCRNGAAEQTVWETLMEMERFIGKAKEEDQ